MRGQLRSNVRSTLLPLQSCSQLSSLHSGGCLPNCTLPSRRSAKLNGDHEDGRQGAQEDRFPTADPPPTPPTHARASQAMWLAISAAEGRAQARDPRAPRHPAPHRGAPNLHARFGKRLNLIVQTLPAPTSPTNASPRTRTTLRRWDRPVWPSESQPIRSKSPCPALELPHSQGPRI